MTPNGDNFEIQKLSIATSTFGVMENAYHLIIAPFQMNLVEANATLLMVAVLYPIKNFFYTFLYKIK